MLKCIKEQIPNFEHKYLKIDIETAAINERHLFVCSNKRPFFHFSQAIYSNGEKFAIPESREGIIYLANVLLLHIYQL